MRGDTDQVQEQQTGQRQHQDRHAAWPSEVDERASTAVAKQPERGMSLLPHDCSLYPLGTPSVPQCTTQTLVFSRAAKCPILYAIIMGLLNTHTQGECTAFDPLLGPLLKPPPPITTSEKHSAHGNEVCLQKILDFTTVCSYGEL